MGSGVAVGDPVLVGTLIVLSESILLVELVINSRMAPEIPTLDELAEITGQDKEQIVRDAKAAANPRGEASGNDGTAVADD